MALLPAVEAAARERGAAVIVATHASTPPAIDFVPREKTSLREGAIRFNAAVLDFARSGSVRSVVLAGRWRGHFTDAKFEAALLRTVDALVGSGLRVYFVLDVPTYPFHVPKALTLYSMWGGDLSSLALPRGEYEKANSFHASLLSKLTDRGVHILDPVAELQRRSSREVDRFLPFDDGGSFYRDWHHLSTYGALAIKDTFMPVFN
jgi:hypothetical protein